MRVLTEEEVLNSYIFWEKSVILMLSNNQTNIRELSKCLGCYRSDTQIFVPLIRFLEEKCFIEVDKTTIPYKIKINSKKLGKFLQKGKPYEINRKLIKANSFMGITVDV